MASSLGMCVRTLVSFDIAALSTVEIRRFRGSRACLRKLSRRACSAPGRPEIQGKIVEVSGSQWTSMEARVGIEPA